MIAILPYQVCRPANFPVTQYERDQGGCFDRHLSVDFEELEIY